MGSRTAGFKGTTLLPAHVARIARVAVFRCQNSKLRFAGKHLESKVLAISWSGKARDGAGECSFGVELSQKVAE